MPTPAIVLNLLFFPSIIVGKAVLFWAFRETTKAGIWPTERFFGFQCRRSFQLFSVIKSLRQLIQDTDDAVAVRRYRRWLNAIFLVRVLHFSGQKLLSVKSGQPRTIW